MGTAWTRTVERLLGSSTARDACGRMAPQTSTTYGWSIDQEGLRNRATAADGRLSRQSALHR